MATLDAPSTSLLSLLSRSFPRAVSPHATDADLPTLSPKIYPDESYTPEEQAEISKWLSASTQLGKTTSGPDGGAAIGSSDSLKELDQHLADRATLLGTKPSVADIALYARLAPTLESWSVEQKNGKAGYVNILRHLDAVQNSPIFGLKIPEDEKVRLEVPETPSATPEPSATPSSAATHKPLVVGLSKDRSNDSSPQKPSLDEKAKEKVQDVKAAVTGDKKQAKKEKKPKQPAAAPASPAPLSPALIDLRVGHILRAIAHPNADSLYVSTITMGDAPGTDNTQEDEQTGQIIRTVCSGLNGLIPLEDMQDRKVVVVANLKPVTMRGIKSAAMVLAASPRVAEGEDDHAPDRKIELVSPPPDAPAGERVFFEGYGGEPEKVLNPKKKVWETIQPGFFTTEDLTVAFDPTRVEALKAGEGSAEGGAKPGVGKLVTKSFGECTVKSLKDAVVR